MATPSHSQSVKSLNKSAGRRRFVFKNFSQRLEEIEIDVFRSLDPLKAEPSDGSSFLRECLLQWRELNTAEDFISFYEEMMPFVQTFPQVLLHKETIMSKLLSRLHMGARLSVEPLLRLIAALSKDLLVDFAPTTLQLRYYPKDYVQELMAESVSFLLRNAPVEQLIKGIRKIIFEAVKKPSYLRESAVSALLLHTLRGTSSRFHSRAHLVLRLLIDSSIIDIGDTSTQGLPSNIPDLCNPVTEMSGISLNYSWSQEKQCYAFSEVWEAICEFLLHPHLWLRSISSRLVAHYFSTASEACTENHEKKKLENLLLMRPSRLFRIAVSFCCQLKTQLTDDAACIFITQNLGFAICGMHSLAGQSKYLGLQEFWSTLNLKEQGHFVKAFQLLGSRKGISMLAFLNSCVKSEYDQDCVQDLQSLLVSPLLKKMGKVALQIEDIQIGLEGCQRYAIEILLPLYKVCEGFAGKVIAGVENFVNAYSEIRKSLEAKRDKRRHEEKLMAVVNPMQNAKRKLKIAAKHKAHKKQKIMTMKMSRRR